MAEETKPSPQSNDADAPPSPARRSFMETGIHLLSAGVTAAVGVPVLGTLLSPVLAREDQDKWSVVAPIDQFPEGQTVRTVFKQVKQDGWMQSENPVTVYVTRQGEQYQVLSAICTHLGCSVNWDETKKQYLCPCHDAQFAPDGKVLGGPPPSPLAKLESRVTDGQLEVKEV